MGYRVDRVKVCLTIYITGQGINDIVLDYVPSDGDEVVIAALAKKKAMDEAAVRNEPMSDGSLFFG